MQGPEFKPQPQKKKWISKTFYITVYIKIK